MVDISAVFTPINTILIVLTLGLGVSTHIFQVRTSLRESLEQIDSLWVFRRDEYVGVFLHSFQYLPFIKRKQF